MSVDEKTVRRVAHLARLEVAEERLQPMVKELNAILAWVEQLGELDTSAVAPMTSVRPMPLPLRADKVTDGGSSADIVRNAPQSEDGFFVVPKVVE